MKAFPTYAIFLSNLVPVVGIMFFGWSIKSVFFLYWYESIILFIFAVPAIVTAQKKGKKKYGRTIQQQRHRALKDWLFFFLSFGVGTGTYLNVFLFPYEATYSGIFTGIPVFDTSLSWAVLTLIVIYTYTAVQDYMLEDTQKRTKPFEPVLEPAGRSMFLICLLFAGLWFSAALHPFRFLLVFIGIKTFYEFLVHKAVMLKKQQSV